MVTPMFDPAHYWNPYFGLLGSPEAGGLRQTSISDYGRLHSCWYLVRLTKMLWVAGLYWLIESIKEVTLQDKKKKVAHHLNIDNAILSIIMYIVYCIYIYMILCIILSMYLYET